MEKFPQNKNPKMAIVGMDCFVGRCQGLDAFERSIYQGIQHFIPLPPHRTPAIELPEETLTNPETFNSKTPLGAYIKDFEIDVLNLLIPPDELDKFKPQDLLMLQVANNALKDAGLDKQTKMAVVIVTATEVLPPQINDSEYPNQNTNKLASYISRLWDAASPAFALNAEQDSVFQALNLAQKLLANKQVDAIIVGAVDLSGLENHQTNLNTGVNTLSYDQNANGSVVGEGAAAVVLKLHDTAKQDQNRIYAVIDALGLVENSQLHPKAVTQACQVAFNLADIKPDDIGYLEVFASGVQQQDQAEIQGLIEAYRVAETNLRCALGSVKANIGHTYAASGIVSLVKTALCLYHRYIPAVPQWSNPKTPAEWLSSPFYVASQSKPWFLEAEAKKRIAAINSMDVDGSYAHLILSEEPNQKNYSSRYLEQMPFYLFAIAADNQLSLLEQLSTLEKNITNCTSLSAAASQNFTTFKNHQKGTYALAILGRNQDELIREIHRAFSGVTAAFDTGEPWQTPIGSYFTAKPLAEQGKLAFVYPGSFTSYIGLAQNLFRLFPQVHDDPIISNVYHRVANIEKLLYPRSLTKLSNKQLETFEQQLINDPVAMLESEAGIAGIITAILKNYFQIQPQSVFGYSLGETSIMLAQSVWTSFKNTSDYLNSSPLFKTRLSGPKNAVREYWGLPQAQDNQEQDFWSNYALICPVARVREALKQENRVYLCLINTPEEVVISGETQACKRVIQNLNCDAFHTQINHVIHCEPMHSEYDELVRIHTIPTQNVSGTVFYSAAAYEPITIDSNSIGHNIAKTLCQELDFPRLINRVYNDGYRIFVEVGVGSNCSRWIGETLKNKEHVTISVNKRGVDDHVSIVKALAKLLSHRVNLDLSPLYSPSTTSLNKTQSMLKTITLDSGKYNASSVKAKNYQQPIKDTSLNTLENLVDKQQYTPVKSTYSLLEQKHLPNLRNPHYQKLSDNNTRVTKTHAVLLQARQESLQQISLLLQQQLTIYQRLVEQVNKLQ
ncbi:PfaB family protein [Cylindrospermum sp. FACHB-282]|uniref:PfaB family protein n=1 Tax=Cylindrospermum sp. FACHB-282 TaxID=2692794 RepID=UPI001681CA2A|nr:type I polyketide synthase [Cylindrospermum sp. FACHB-282]MBD2387200.1 type I polyketide synthase [Cylindrospermum sp. FACHB-282]